MLRRALAVTLIPLSVVACTTAEPEAPAPTAAQTQVEVPTGGTLRWALGADPTSLDPARIVTREDEVVVDALFDSLTALGPDLEPLPALAESWTSTEDATTWRFVLDDGARWSDGSRVVADDVVRGLQRVADGTAPTPSLHAGLLSSVSGFVPAQQGAPLSGVVGVDERTVEIQLVRPEPALPVHLAHPALAPIPPMVIDDPAGFGESPVGNGPFVLGDPWLRNQFLRLVPAPDHPRPPALDELVFRVYADDVSGDLRWGDLVAGQVQVSDVPLTRRDEVGDALGTGALSDHLVDVTTLLLVAADQEVTDDVRVRRAISLLVDREATAARTNGARVPAATLVPPSFPGVVQVPCRWCRHDPATARTLVEAATAPPPTSRGRNRDVGSSTGGPDGDGAETGDDDGGTSEAPGAVEDGDGAGGDVGGGREDAGGVAVRPSGPREAPSLLVLAPDDGLSIAVAEQVRDGLRSFGLDARFRAVPAVQLPGTVEDVDPAVVVLPWTSAVPTGESFVTELVGPATIGRSITGWRAPSVTDLLQRITSSSDPGERRVLTAELEELAIDEAIVVPLFHARNDLAVSPTVRGFERGPDGSVDLAAIEVAPAP